MIDVVIFGYGYLGTLLVKRIKDDHLKYNIVGFADNAEYKQGYYVYGNKIMSIDELAEKSNVSVIVASEKNYEEIIEKCCENRIKVEGVFLNNRIKKYPWASFESKRQIEGACPN